MDDALIIIILVLQYGGKMEMIKSLFGKTLICILALSIVLSSVLFVFADKPEKINKNNNATIAKVYRVTENGLKEVSIEEYLQHKADTLSQITYNSLSTNSISSDSISNEPIAEDYYVYNESSASLVRRTDLRKRVSIFVQNTTSLPASKTIAYSSTHSYSISGNATFEITQAVKAGVSFTWTDSASINDSATLQIPAYYYGWWEFDPLMNKSVGYVNQYSFTGILRSSTYTTAYSPNKINGNEDGYLIAMNSPTQPTN